MIDDLFTLSFLVGGLGRSVSYNIVVIYNLSIIKFYALLIGCILPCSLAHTC